MQERTAAAALLAWRRIDEFFVPFFLMPRTHYTQRENENETDSSSITLQQEEEEDEKDKKN